MNLAGYPTERRPALTAGDLCVLFGMPFTGVATPEAVAVMAECLEARDEEVLVGFVVDCSDLAADLDQGPEVRRLAAAVASACESVVTGGLADWDTTFDLIDAAKAAPIKKKESEDG